MTINLDAAMRYGLTSIRQLSVFLQHAEQNGSIIFEVTGLSPNTAAYRKHYGIVRKLMKGEPLRENSGLQLFVFGEPDEGAEQHKEYKVWLTVKGHMAYKEIQSEVVSNGSY